MPKPPSGRPRPGWPARLRRPVHGGDYYPEQWPREVVAEDPELMALAGVNAVTYGVFTWALLEPSAGAYDLSRPAEVLDRMAAAGVSVLLATPTASPPPWFSATYPESLPVTREGVRLGIGSREAFCPSSPRYREAAAGIAAALAAEFGGHPALALWHVGNEFGAHVPACYCPVSVRAFRRWLRARYGDLDALNEAWGTVFWSQRYCSWEHVQAPAASPMPCNPAQVLDFRRFCSDELLACYLVERDVLRAAAPDVPVTTNLMAGTCADVDYWSWRQHLDVVANDHYLVAADPEGHLDLSLSADLARALAGGEPWLLVEHSTSAVNWQPRNAAKRPGQLRRNSLAHVARGSEGAMFFQWRASRFGSEKFHSAMLPHAGTASRVWREVVGLGADLARLAPLVGTRTVADVALLWDWQCDWALDAPDHPSVDLRHRDQVARTHAALVRGRRTADVVAPGEPVDPSRHPLLLVPNLYLTTPEAAAALERYVTGGGTLLVGPFSGIVDATDTVWPGAPPGALRGLLGLRVEEVHPLLAGEGLGLRDAAGAVSGGDVWSEAVVPDGAVPVWWFDGGPDDGGPALTRHAVGAGTAWYLAARPDDSGLRRALDLVAAAAGLPDPVKADEGVELVRRTGDAGSFLFALNHTDRPARVDARGVDLLTGDAHDHELVLPPGGAAVLREGPAPA